MEACDNGNKPGCINCVVSKDYKCQGNIGATSVCKKAPRCGDAILDEGEECDNGNKEGCSLNCRTDAGFRCGGQIGYPSSCARCGNGILETGEECDNKNLEGCSKECKVDVGYACRGLITSFCFKSNPVCGNGVSEVGESCDDGNNFAADGCGSTCLIEPGYVCEGEPSQCSKKPLTVLVCGNSLYEPSANQQCDNGNKQGCFGCVVQDGWQCASQPGSPSQCALKIIPHCGNGVYEPSLNEVCDDANEFNGDGCSSFCQVEFGWICPDSKLCFNAEDSSHWRKFCGNGKAEKMYGEACDDGNIKSGDGCSSDCRVESGWFCQTLNIINRSFCSKGANSNGYCGNGKLEEGEQCDDGFPLKNKDGCNVSCQIENGWTCRVIPLTGISQCKQI